MPCNASVTGWLQRILDKLGPDSQALACILRRLGTNDVPKKLFDRARKPSLTWDSAGEVTGLLPRIVPFIQEGQLFEAAVRKLKAVGFAFSTDQSISLNQRISDLLRSRLEDPKWATEAARVVVHAFPKYSSIESTLYVLPSAV